MKNNSNNINFRIATKRDGAKVLALYHSLIGPRWCGWNLNYPNKELVDKDIANKSLFVLTENKEIIAAAFLGKNDELYGLKWTSKNPCEVARIAVTPLKHGKGLGSHFLTKLIQTALELGFDSIRLTVKKTNCAAIALYDKFGFVRCGEVSMFNMDFYCYEKLLSATKHEN